MKPRHFLGLLALVVTVAFMVGCPTTPAPDYVGTWSMANWPILGAGTTITITLTKTTMSIAVSGTMAGTLDQSLVIDEGAKHMTGTTTAVTGGLTGGNTIGSILYWTYSVAGTVLNMNNSPTAFPPDATGSGLALTKQ
jgi:hypothetical protein